MSDPGGAPSLPLSRKREMGRKFRRNVFRQMRSLEPLSLNAPISPAILLDTWRAVMGSSQKRAIQNYRTRLGERGLARFEVLGRDADRELIRSLARRLATDDPEALRLRAAVSRSMAGEAPKKGGILAALRRSPLVGADLDLARPRDNGRKVEI